MLEELFRQIGEFFIFYCSIEFEIFEVRITVGSILAFTVIAGIIIDRVKGMAD